MEDLQLEEKLDWLNEITVSKFIASFTEPIQLCIENTMKFECQFDLQEISERSEDLYFY